MSVENEYSEVKALLQKFKDYVATIETRGEEISSLKAKAEFADRLTRFAHDIRGPLTAIHTVAKIPLDQVNVDALELLNIASKRADRLANDLLREYKTGRKTTPAADLKLLASEVIKEKLATNGKGFQISLSVGAEQPFESKIDPETFARVFSNILNNSIEASETRREIEILLAHGEKCVDVLVKDHGRGIRPTDLAQLNNGKALSVGKESGFGIGLSSAHSALNALGGSLHIQSIENEGTVVKMSLPL